MIYEQRARTDMAAVASIPRSRGSLCGFALLVLGAWGGLAPFAGPSFGYGFNPDQTWHYTQGRLYLSALPGAIVLIAGLGILLTRSRGFGGFLAFVAAVGGAWFIVGASAVQLLPASVAGSITTGSAIGTTVHQVVLTNIGLFWGVGALIVFFAALALGRFSIAGQTDGQQLGSWSAGSTGATAPLGGSGYQSAHPGFATQPQYPIEPIPSYSPDQFGSQYPSGSYQPEQQSQETEPEQFGSQYPSQYPPEPTAQNTAVAPDNHADGGSDATQTQARP
jgi:hypothetical protein